MIFTLRASFPSVVNSFATMGKSCKEELDGNMFINNITLLQFRHSAREYRRNMIKVDKTGPFLIVFSNLPR